LRSQDRLQAREHLDDLMEDVPFYGGGKFTCMLRESGMTLSDTQILQHQKDDQLVPAAAKELPRQTSNWQLYTVVFNSLVAVREYPSTKAKMIRGLKPGAQVRCFEWDNSREWRRVRVKRLVADQGAGKVENLQDADGWVLINSPAKGLLLRVAAHNAEQREETDKVYFKKFEEGGPEKQQEPGQSPERMSQDNDDAPVEQLQEAKSESPLKSMQVSKLLSQTELDEILNSVEDRRAVGEPRLMTAVRAGSFRAVDCLLRQFADVNEQDNMGETALFEAVSAGHVAIAGHLLLCRANPHSFGTPTSMMAMAADPPTQALLLAWMRQPPADHRALHHALLRLTEADKKRTVKLLEIPESPVHLIMQAEASAAAQNPNSPLRAGERASADALRPAPGAPRLEDLELDEETGAPRRQEKPTLYRVALKNVYVRATPNVNAKKISIKQLDDLVEMFEWDKTLNWRRVKEIIELEEGDEVATTDCWMMIYDYRRGARALVEADEAFDDFENVIG